MTRSKAAMAVSEGRSAPYKLGYRDGLTGRRHTNPWDGRVKAGREWRRGYLAGSNDKAMQSQRKDEAGDEP